MLEEIKDIKDLAERLKFTSNAEDQRELVEKLLKQIDALENRIKELQGQVNGLMAEKEELKKQIEVLKEEKQKLLARNEQLENENEQLKQEKEKLRKEKSELEDKVERQVPWLFTLSPADLGQPVEVYLREVKVASVSGQLQPPYDPELKFHFTFWPGDFLLRLGASTTWVSQDRMRGTEIKVYGKLVNDPEQRKTTMVYGSILGDKLPGFTIPSFSLTPERFWTLIGTVVFDDNRTPKFTVATQQERDAEWTILTKAKPPAEPPPSAPIIESDPNGLARKRDNMRRAPGGLSNRMLEGLSPAATQRVQIFASSLTTATDEGERRVLFQAADAASEDAAERDVIRAIMVRVTAMQPRPGNTTPPPRAPGAGPAIPFGVNPGPPTPAAPPAPAPSRPTPPAPK